MSACVDISSLRSKTAAELQELGCHLWDESGLMLFPKEWFDAIPDGFVVVSISGACKPWNKGLSNDHRFGMLAYGIIPGELAP
jgi:hypothetical protein